MGKKLENKFLEIRTINSDGTTKVEKELIIEDDRISRIIKTISRSKSKSITSFIKKCIIIEKQYVYCGAGEIRIMNEETYKARDYKYNKLNLQLQVVGLQKWE